MKIKDLLKITGISLIGVLGVGLSIFGSAKGMTLLNTYQSASAYSVNQQEDSVTFTKEELNNCSYTYLTVELYEDYSSLGNITYNDLFFDGDEYDGATLSWFHMDDNDNIDFGIIFDFDNGKWNLYSGNYDVAISFDFSLVVYNPFFSENMQKSVTLTASQLNNITYEYFAEYVNDNAVSSNFTDSYIIYNNVVYTFEEFISGESLAYINGNNEIRFYCDEDVDWVYYESSIEDFVYFNNSITIYSTYIADNLYAPYQPTSLLETIVLLLTGGITGIASGVGSGVSTLTTQIFISNNALSVFGGMIVVFAGISLAIGLCRWIMQFLTSLGAKK